MGGFFNGLIALLTGGTASKALDIALEKTEDVDKRNAMLLEYVRIKEETRRAELARVTVPWVDALHKMGRQIFWLTSLVGILTLIGLGHGDELMRYAGALDTTAAGGLLYTLMKGRGQ